MLNILIAELHKRGASFVKIADISGFPAKQTQGYPIALLIGIALSPAYIARLSQQNVCDHSEFSNKEMLVDRLAEWAAEFIISRGHQGFAQSESNLISHRLFNSETKTTPLPHKTIAVMGELGWIGKNNLLVTKEYGCAFCMCTVLTNAPLPVENKPVVTPQCKECSVCKDVCPVQALHGSTWGTGINRDLMVDVYRCTTCLKCLVHCPWTQKYALRGSDQ